MLTGRTYTGHSRMELQAPSAGHSSSAAGLRSPPLARTSMLRLSAVSLLAVLPMLACAGEAVDGGITKVPGAGRASVSGGSGGSGGGEGGTGGGAVEVDPKAVIPSMGCGMPLPANVEPGTYAKFEVDVTGVTLTAFKHPPHK